MYDKNLVQDKITTINDKTMQKLPVRSATILFGLIVVAVTYSPIVAYR